jgi:SH3-like domain-containing protein
MLWLGVLAAGLFLPGCRRVHRAQEVAYVSAPQVFLRDHVAAVYAKTGVVKNGERVEVLERERRFARVRTASGAEGWLEQRYLVTQQVYDGFQKLTQQEKSAPVQAAGTTRNDTNLHLEPGRETEHLYQLNQGSKISLLQRATAEKVLPGAPPRPGAENKVGSKPGAKAETKAEAESAAAALLEDWWLIRDADGQVGWVLARMVDLDLPLEIAQYAEGQRSMAYFALDQVTDGDKKVSEYLVAFTESKDGMPFDFNQVRVFTWNVKKHRYETAYREHNLNGVLPVTVTQENFDKEGMLLVFVLRVIDDNGNVSERKYKLATPIVRRVLAPGESAEKKGRGR